MPTAAYTTPGGITVPGSAYTGDISNLLRGLFDGSNNGDDVNTEHGLETQTIPTFYDYGALLAAYPPDTPVEQTPPLVRVYAPGDDVGVLLRLDPSLDGAAWTPIAGFAALQDGAFDTAGYAPVGAGQSRGLTTLTVPTVGQGQALITVSAAARFNFSSEDDELELVLRVKAGSGALTEVRRVTCPAPKVLHASAVLPTYSFLLNGGDGFTLQTIFVRTLGDTGTCIASAEPRYTNLQFFAQSL